MSYSEGVSIRPRFSTIYFDDIHSKTLDGVAEEKRKCQETVYKIREKLAMLIAGNPKDLMGDDEEYADPMTWINWQLNEIEEDLQSALQKYGELNVYEMLLDEWENGHFHTKENWEDLYRDITDTANSNIIFPEEDFVDKDFKYQCLIGKKKVDDKSVKEAFERGLKNVALDEPHRKEVYAMTYALIDGELFITYKGQWMFTSHEEAMNAVKHRLNIPVLEYVKKNFVENHPDFFESLGQWLTDDEIEELNNFVHNFDKLTIMSKEYSRMYELVNKGIDGYIESRVKFYYVFDNLLM